MSVSLLWLQLVLVATTYAVPVAKTEEDYYPKPYEFGYQMDDGNGTVLHRQETANGEGVVKGSYGYVDGNGIYRQVEYNADKNGYHAKISSNEPGVINQNSADAIYTVQLNRQQ